MRLQQADVHAKRPEGGAGVHCDYSRRRMSSEEILPAPRKTSRGDESRDRESGISLAYQVDVPTPS